MLHIDEDNAESPEVQWALARWSGFQQVDVNIPDIMASRPSALSMLDPSLA